MCINSPQIDIHIWNFGGHNHLLRILIIRNHNLEVYIDVYNPKKIEDQSQCFIVNHIVGGLVVFTEGSVAMLV